MPCKCRRCVRTRKVIDNECILKNRSCFKHGMGLTLKHVHSRIWWISCRLCDVFFVLCWTIEFFNLELTQSMKYGKFDHNEIRIWYYDLPLPRNVDIWRQTHRNRIFKYNGLVVLHSRSPILSTNLQWRIAKKCYTF